jgi:uncharacterized protein
MTTSHARGVSLASLDESSVAEYLQNCPDFFERNAALLTKLRLPHMRNEGTTVSLVERQIEVLRDRNLALERKLKELIDVARSNGALADRIHRLSQRLIGAHDFLQTVNAIEKSLREDFDALHVVLILFTDAAREVQPEAPKFLRADSPDSPDMHSFESLLQSGKPRCGQIRDSQREFLFGTEAPGIGSVALIPLGGQPAPGLLALGSIDRERFHPGMSTEFLARMGELITDALIRP